MPEHLSHICIIPAIPLGTEDNLQHKKGFKAWRTQETNLLKNYNDILFNQLFFRRKRNRSNNKKKDTSYTKAAFENVY